VGKSFIMVESTKMSCGENPLQKAQENHVSDESAKLKWDAVREKERESGQENRRGSGMKRLA